MNYLTDKPFLIYRTYTGRSTVAKTFRDWMTEGEELYSIAMREYEQLQSQLESLQTQLAAKKDEVNQIAAVIGKPQVDNDNSDLAKIELPKTEPKSDRHDRKPVVQIVDRETPGSIPASRNTIAQALTGRGLGR
jgi:DNA-binding protein H-NS